MSGLEATDCPFTVCIRKRLYMLSVSPAPRLCLVGYVDLEPGSWDTRESDLKVES